MRLHPLQSMNKDSSAFAVDFSVFGNNGTLKLTSRPEFVDHRSPRSLGVCSEVGRAILSSHKARGVPCELEIDQAVLVACRLDGIEGAILRELEGYAICEERVLLLVEAVVFKRVGGPKVGFLVVGVEHLAVELAGNS